jgi:hypothetical protein
MSETFENPDAIAFEECTTAPFVYFDVVHMHGALNGTVQIELAARIMVPKQGAAGVKLMTSGRLRCSPVAARHLRDAINGVLQLLEQAQSGASASPKMN